MGQPGAKIEPFLRCFYPVPCPSFTSFSLCFFFWKGCPDLSGFDQTKFGLSFLPHAIQTLWSRWMLAHLRYTSLSRYNEGEKEDCTMRKQKFKITLTPAENSIVIQSLNRLRNTLLRENRDTGCVDDLLLKVMCAPVKRIWKLHIVTDWIKPFILS